MAATEGKDMNYCIDKTGEFYKDPEDCTSFYQCYARKTTHYVCPFDLFFNSEINVCDWPENVNCGSRSTVSQTSSKTDPTPELTSSTSTSPAMTSSTTSIPTSQSSKKPENEVTTTGKATSTVISPLSALCENNNDGLYPDPESCNGFYRCYQRNYYRFTCPAKLVFNNELKLCDWSWNVNCLEPKGNSIPTQESIRDITSQTVETATVNSTSAAKCGKVVCYVPNWAIYRSGLGARFGPEDINPELCTHIIYAFATLRGNRLTALADTDEPSRYNIGNFARVTNIKLRNPDVKVLIAVGGGSMQSNLFSNMAANEQSRAEFISSVIGFLREKNFDGLDLDWEYPNTIEDRVRHATLCEELRAAFDKEATGVNRLILSGAVAAGKYNIDFAYDVPRISAALDIINVMSYDLHGPWDSRTGHNSPLKFGAWEANAEANLNVEWVANYWVTLGAPKNKLVIGIPLYARTFTLSSTSSIGVGAPSTAPGLRGQYTGERGYLSYYEVCTMFNYSTKYFIDDQRVPYLVSGNQWIGYDDQGSVREKVKFIRENGFGGVMLWDLSQDDFSGRFCGQGSYPVTTAVISQCGASVGTR